MHASPVQLRHGQPGDAPALARFAARIFADTFGPDNRPEHITAHLGKSFGPVQQGRELADPDFVTLLGHANGEIVAYAQVRRATPPACVTTDAPVELYRFYVDRPWQGTGLAQRLMAAVHAAASALGGRSLWLSVWERNPRAISFYTKSGYREVGGATFYLGTDRQSDRVLVAVVQEPALHPTNPAAPAEAEGEQMRLGNFSVSLAVKDIGASRAFYEKLGFRVLLGDQAKNWLILQNDTSTIGLFQGMFSKNTLTFNPGWDRNGGTLPDFDDVRDIQRTLKEHGLTVAPEADEAGTGPASLMVLDPDGNPILLDQHVPRPKK